MAHASRAATMASTPLTTTVAMTSCRYQPRAKGFGEWGQGDLHRVQPAVVGDRLGFEGFALSRTLQARVEHASPERLVVQVEPGDPADQGVNALLRIGGQRRDHVFDPLRRLLAGHFEHKRPHAREVAVHGCGGDQRHLRHVGNGRGAAVAHQQGGRVQQRSPGSALLITPCGQRAVLSMSAFLAPVTASMARFSATDRCRRLVRSTGTSSTRRPRDGDSAAGSMRRSVSRWWATR